MSGSRTTVDLPYRVCVAWISTYPYSLLKCLGWKVRFYNQNPVVISLGLIRFRAWELQSRFSRTNLSAPRDCPILALPKLELTRCLLTIWADEWTSDSSGQRTGSNLGTLKKRGLVTKVRPENT